MTLTKYQNIIRPLDGNYILNDDIDCNETITNDAPDWLNGYEDDGFQSIGAISHPFTGVLDGNGYSINQMKFNQNGLIVKNMGTIENLGINLGEPMQIRDTNNFGVISDVNNSLIQNVYVTGDIAGNSVEVGGIVGSNLGEINNSYYVGDVQGSSKVGGISGSNRDVGTINNAYAIGDIEGNSLTAGIAGDNMGIVINTLYSGNIITNATGDYLANSKVAVNSYVSSTTTISVEPSFTTKKIVTPDNLQNIEFYQDYLMWDNQNWNYDGLVDQYYPQVNDSNSQLITNQPDVSIDLGNPPVVGNVINTCKDLESIGQGSNYPGATHSDAWLLDENYYMIKDIDCSGINFIPIGSEEYPFTGEFLGEGYQIINLTIDSSNQNTGLFSNNAGLISEVVLNDVNIKGDNYVGSIAGINSGVITETYATGVVTGEKQVGGLVGENQNDINNSYTNVLTIGAFEVGGITGVLNGTQQTADLDHVYSLGDVRTTKGLSGGLVGKTTSNTKITNSFTSSNVEDLTSNAGPIVGANQATLENVYYDERNHIMGQSNYIGQEVSQQTLKNSNFYYQTLGFDVDIWNIEAVADGYYPQLSNDSGEQQNLI